jgi:hypothetical protein
MATHELKCWPTSFQGIKRGDKTFEVRLDDRGYAVGDTLNLNEWDPVNKVYSGDKLSREVVWLLRADESEFFGIKYGYVVMSIR